MRLDVAHKGIADIFAEICAETFASNNRTACTGFSHISYHSSEAKEFFEYERACACVAVPARSLGEEAAHLQLRGATVPAFIFCFLMLLPLLCLSDQTAPPIIAIVNI